MLLSFKELSRYSNPDLSGGRYSSPNRLALIWAENVYKNVFNVRKKTWLMIVREIFFYITCIFTSSPGISTLPFKILLTVVQMWRQHVQVPFFAANSVCVWSMGLLFLFCFSKFCVLFVKRLWFKTISKTFRIWVVF